ncbi:MAG: hypothetical protein ACI3T9_03345 [Romboutsia timonensis]
MKVVLNDDGYINMVVRTGNLVNSIEVPEEDLDMRYISCYKLDDDKKNLVLDVEKVQALENSLKISTLIQSYKQQVSNTDYKVLRHIRETALGIKTSMTQEEYLELEAERESIVRQIRELEDGTTLETDAEEILKEGSSATSE